MKATNKNGLIKGKGYKVSTIKYKGKSIKVVIQALQGKLQ